MGRVITFSEFRAYSKSLPADCVRGTILDTNILIALTYEAKPSHEKTWKFLDDLFELGFSLFTTVNTRAEYLDFQRRLIMTENLLDSIDEHSNWKISTLARTQIQAQSGLVIRAKKNQGSDPVFSDRQLKKIKSAFSAGMHSGQVGWLKLCRSFLKDRLLAAENELTSFNIGYISQHDPKQKDYFQNMIDWPEARRLAEESCVGVADAMIINASQCTKFPFLVSADFDIGYAALASSDIKDVVMPDSVAKVYRDYHFDSAP